MLNPILISYKDLVMNGPVREKGSNIHIIHAGNKGIISCF